MKGADAFSIYATAARDFSRAPSSPPAIVSTGLNDPAFLAVKGNTLCAANFANGTVGKYDADANTVAAVNRSLIMGLNDPDLKPKKLGSGTAGFVKQGGAIDPGPKRNHAGKLTGSMILGAFRKRLFLS